MTSSRSKGNDLRVLSDNARKLLLNKDVVAISQDPAGRAGIRLGGDAAANAPTQTWIRSMENGDVAVGLYNQGPPQQHPWHSKCDAFNVTQGGYHAPTGDQPASWCGPALGETLMEWYCCNTDDCAGYNFSATTKSGCMFKNLDGRSESALATENLLENTDGVLHHCCLGAAPCYLPFMLTRAILMPSSFHRRVCKG